MRNWKWAIIILIAVAFLQPAIGETIEEQKETIARQADVIRKAAERQMEAVKKAVKKQAEIIRKLRTENSKLQNENSKLKAQIGGIAQNWQPETMFRGHRYMLMVVPSDVKGDWFVWAHKQCLKMEGGHLVIFETKEEKDWVARKMGHVSRAFVGAQYRTRGKDKKKTWCWLDDSEVLDSWWNVEAMNNGKAVRADFKYVVLEKGGTLSKHYSSGTNVFICEWDRP